MQEREQHPACRDSRPWEGPGQPHCLALVSVSLEKHLAVWERRHQVVEVTGPSWAGSWELVTGASGSAPWGRRPRLPCLSFLLCAAGPRSTSLQGWEASRADVCTARGQEWRVSPPLLPHSHGRGAAAEDSSSREPPSQLAVKMGLEFGAQELWNMPQGWAVATLTFL